jgi:NAD(P)-dependent dehydrogenase (short-subunit alcohol dehydrogenase family)
VKQSDLFNIKDHVAFVTGAASGLGLAYAEVMAENGARVVLADINAEGLEAVHARLKAAGCAVEPLTVDIGDDEALRNAIEGTAARHGRLGHRVRECRGQRGTGFLVDSRRQHRRGGPRDVRPLDGDQLPRQLSDDPFRGDADEAAAAGSIIATSSIAGIKSDPLVSYGYVAAKAAINNVVRHAAVDLAPYNVRVNAIAPGPFYTNIAGGRLRRDPERAKKFAEMIPMARIGEPDEIKGLALLLASPAGSFITGTVIPIDGGRRRSSCSARPRESGDPVLCKHWMPAFAGMSG